MGITGGSLLKSSLTMRSLEDTLTSAGKPTNARLDAMVIAPLILLTVMLLPGWSAPQETYMTDVAGQVASPRLLMALAMLLALRVGAIDLSVWVVTAGGSLLAAGLIGRGVRPAVAFGLAAVAGAVVGAINGTLVTRAKLPSPVATMLVALAVMGGCWLAVPPGGIAIPDDTFSDWLMTTSIVESNDTGVEIRTEVPYPLMITRTIIISAVYALTLAALLPWRRWPLPVKWRRTLALTGAGALAALAGACWLMDFGRAAVPIRPIGDLRIPAAALLAGSAILAGPGRTLMVGAALPVALLAGTMWRQEVWTLGAWGYEWHVAVLIGLTLLVHLTATRVGVWLGSRRLIAGIAYALVLIAIALLAADPLIDSQPLLVAARRLGVSAAAAALLLLLAGWRISPRADRQSA